jgi:stage V sporulation protein G
MNITEVRVKLIEDKTDNRLRAFCSITIDHAFVVRDLKVIDGPRGLFISMPSRKRTDRCQNCGYKNNLQANYCNECGDQLYANRVSVGEDGRARLHADIAHPINSSCRDTLQRLVVSAYHTERERAKQPGYVCSYDSFHDSNS